jgi:bifunctional non-homologous end joining protein LigD
MRTKIPVLIVGDCDAPPSGSGWIHEPKIDGWRCLAILDGEGRVKLQTRSGNEPPSYFVEPFAVLAKCGRVMILDGEVAVPDERGVTHLGDLHDTMKFKQSGRMAYFAFDLLELDGQDLRNLPVEARKAKLAALLRQVETGPRVVYVEHVEMDGPRFFDAVVAAGGEGIVSKRLGSRYSAHGVSTSWLKSKSDEAEHRHSKSA